MQPPDAPLEPKARRHVSPSEVREFLSCPLRWHYRYRLGLWTDTTTAYFALGNAVHAGLERYYLSERLNGVRDREGALRQFAATWADESAKVDWAAEPNREPLALRTAGGWLLGVMMDEPDEWVAAAGEETLHADIEHSRLGKLPVPLKVRLDLRTSLNDVVEHKTADKSWPRNKEHSDAQATAQVVAVRANFGHDPTVTFNIGVTTATPKVERRSTRRTQDDIDRFYLQVRAMLDAEEKGAVYPNPFSFAHPTCEFRTLCDAWEGHPQPLPSGRRLQLLVPGLGAYAARVPGATWGRGA